MEEEVVVRLTATLVLHSYEVDLILKLDTFGRISGISENTSKAVESLNVLVLRFRDWPGVIPVVSLVGIGLMMAP